MPKSTKLILSTVSTWDLGEHFEVTQAKKNEALRDAKIAKQDGDLSENAPYQAAKDKFRTMGRIQRRLTREMNYIVKQGHIVVDPISWVKEEPVDKIEIGVVARIEQNGSENEFLIGGARDNHIPDAGTLLPIPYCSPLGCVLEERKVGDQFTAEVNGRSQKIRVVAVRRPTLEEILNVFPKLRDL
jgi:transcription elongation GreA/GreB family factor